MSILDRSIARQYLINIGVLFLILFAIVVLVDYSLNFDEYTRIAARIDSAEMSSGAVGKVRQAIVSVLLVLDLWWPRLFQMYNFLLGLVLVGAMGFTLSQMVRHREMVAMLAGGISLQRVARPILLVALVMIGLQALNRELVVPRLAELLTREKWDAGKRSLAADRLRLGPDAKGRRFYAATFDPEAARIEKLYVYEIDQLGLLRVRTTADEAHWDGTVWQLKNGRAERREGDRLVVDPVSSIDTDLDPTTLTLRRFEGYAQNLSTAQLTRLIDRYKQDGAAQTRIDALDRIRFGRLAVMLSTLLALVICLPFYLRRSPTSMIVQSLWCAPVAIVAVMGSTLGATAAVPGLPPAIGAFVPVMVLIPLAVAAFSSVRT